MKKLIITLLLLAFSSATAQQKRPFLPKPSLPEKPAVTKENFGQWLDKDGFITDGPKIKNWIDSDRDRIDDRFQPGPGKPAGKKRPEVEKPRPEPKPRPIKPKKPTKPTSSEGKPSKPERPTKPARPELSQELKEKMESYKEEKDKLHKELKEVIKKLEKPSREKVKEAVAAFHKNNKNRFDAHKDLAKSIKEGLVQNRPDRPKKPEVSPEVKVLHKSHADKLKELHESKKKLMTSLKNTKGEERKKMLDSFREEQRSLHNELKNIQKQLRDQIAAHKGDSARDAEDKRVERHPPPRPKPGSKNTADRRPTTR